MNQYCASGYDAMGDWKMSKPDLRAGLEADLKMVCEGRKTKEEVIQHFQISPGSVLRRNFFMPF